MSLPKLHCEEDCYSQDAWTQLVGQYAGVKPLLKHIAERMDLAMVYVAFESVGELGMTMTKSLVVGAIPGVNPAQFVRGLSESSGHVSGGEPNHTMPFTYLGLTNAALQDYACKVLFFSTTAPESELNAALPTFQEAHRLIALAGLVRQKNARIRELEKDIRYQIVWSECLEWLKTVSEENDALFEGLLLRSAVISETELGTLRVKGKTAEDDRWYERGDLKGRLASVTSEEGEGMLLGEDKRIMNDLVLLKAEHPDLELTNLLRLPFTLVEGDLEGVLFLANKKEGKEFALLDEIYISQIFDYAANNIAFSRLMEELTETNASLQEEKFRQEQLIAELKDTQNKLVQAEKMASIGTLAAGVAHEINNPIGYVNSNLTSLGRYTTDLLGALDRMTALVESGGNAEQIAQVQGIAQELDLEFLKEDLEMLVNESLEGTTRVTQIVQDLRDYSRLDSTASMLPSDLLKGLDSTLNIVHNELKYKATIVKEYGELPLVPCVASQINQVFMNLLVNAGQAIDQQGTITLRSWVEGEYAVVSVSDTGKGIPPDILPKLFEPFFTTKPVGKGTGLGLSLSYSIVEAHHGSIDVESEVGQGTTFSVRLPLIQPETDVD